MVLLGLRWPLILDDTELSDIDSPFIQKFLVLIFEAAHVFVLVMLERLDESRLSE